MAGINIPVTFTGDLSSITSGLGKSLDGLTSGFERAASKAVSGFEGPLKSMGSRFGEQGRQLGTALVSGLRTVGTAGVAAVGGVMAAAAGTAITKGLGRLNAIDQAQAKLRGLGNDAEQVEQIMGNALASVEGTAFGLGEAATTAAGAVAAGIAPGKELEAVLSTVANTAAAAGTGMDEMGGIFNRVAANGKASNQELQQLSDRGIPIYAALADQLGVTAEEVFKMASAGKIGFQEFSDAATAASGSVAEEMGKTVTGSLANLKASLGRIGANIMGPVFEQLPGMIQGVTAALKPLEQAATVVGENIGQGLSAIFAGLSGGDISGFEGTLGKVASVAASIGESLSGVGEKLAEFWSALGGGGQTATIIGAVVAGVAAFGTSLGPLLGALGPVGSLIGSLLPTLGQLGGLLRFATGPLGILITLFTSAFATSEEFRGAVMGLLGSLLPLGQTLISAVAPVLAMLPQLFSMIVAAVTPLLTVIVELASDLISALVPVIQNLIGSILPPLMDLFRALVPAVLALVPVIAQLASMLGDLLVPVIESLLPIVSTVFSAVGAVIGSLVPIVEALVSTISALVAGDWSGAWEGFKAVLSGAFAFMDTLAGAALEVGRQIIFGLINGVRALLGALGNQIRQVGTSIINWFKSVLGISSPSRVFQNFGRDILQGLINGIRALISTVGSTIRSVGSTMISLFRGAVASVRSVLSGLRGIASSALSSMAGAVSAGVSRVVGFFRNLGGQVRGAVSGLAGSLRSVGTQMMQGMINGLAGMAGAVAAKARSVVQGAVDGAKRLLKIASPSKVFRDIGLYIDQGLVKGMTGGEAKVKSTADSLTKKVINAFDKITKDSKFNPGAAAEVAARRLIRSEASRLRSLASQRETMATRIKRATKKLEDAVKVRDDAFKSIRDNVLKMADVTAVEGKNQADVTGGNIVSSLRSTLRDAKEYNQILKVLRKRGLGDTVYAQLVEQGPAALDSARALKSGGTAIVKQVNNLQKRIRTQANALARTSSRSLYQGGVDAAAGLVKGLRSQDKKLAAQAKKMARTLAREVKRELKISSPSRVFQEIGNFTGQGLVVGLDEMARAAEQAGRGLAEAARSGAVDVNPPRTTSRTSAASTATAAAPTSTVINLNEYGPRTYSAKRRETEWAAKYSTRARSFTDGALAIP